MTIKHLIRFIVMLTEYYQGKQLKSSVCVRAKSLEMLGVALYNCLNKFPTSDKIAERR
jgi:hypothetical protein